METKGDAISEGVEIAEALPPGEAQRVDQCIEGVRPNVYSVPVHRLSFHTVGNLVHYGPIRPSTAPCIHRQRNNVLLPEKTGGAR